MSNNYMTEQYMTSILNQYQHKSPIKSPLKGDNGSQNYESFNHFYGNEESIRRQLNESLFQCVDTSGAQPMKKTSNDLNPMKTIHKLSVNPLITSDSFVKPKPKTGPSVRSSYYGQSLPQTRSRPQYRAKVIDYSFETRSIPKANPMAPNSRPLSVSSSVLTERNVDPLDLQKRTVESVNALLTAINSVTQKTTVQKPVFPKPILKDKSDKLSAEFTRMSEPSFDRMTRNTADIRQTPIPKPSISTNNSNIASNQTQSTQLRDTFVVGYQNEGIIQTKDFDKNETFFCYFCNSYIKKLSTVEKHCKNYAHRQCITRTTSNSLQNSLNKRLILKQMNPKNSLDFIGLKTETLVHMALDRIPIVNRHYYYINGIRIGSPSGPDGYYCNLCEQSIPTFDGIETHLVSKSHQKHDNKPTIMKFLSINNQPIVGLQFITEYISAESCQPTYECTLCHCFEDAFDMYSHVCGFKHRINLLKYINPNEKLDSISETPKAKNEILKRIDDLQHMHGTGAIVRVNRPVYISRIQNKRNRDMTSGVEVIDITDDEEMPDLRKHLSVRVVTDDDAANASLVINSLKESVVKYYLSKIPTNMRRVLIDEVMN